MFDKEMIEGNVDVGQRVDKLVGDGGNVDEDEGDFDVYERVEKLVGDGENVNEDEGDFDSFLEIMLLDQKGCLIEALKRNFNVLKRGML